GLACATPRARAPPRRADLADPRRRAPAAPRRRGRAPPWRGASARCLAPERSPDLAAPQGAARRGGASWSPPGRPSGGLPPCGRVPPARARAGSCACRCAARSLAAREGQDVGLRLAACVLRLLGGRATLGVVPGHIWGVLEAEQLGSGVRQGPALLAAQTRG